VIEFAKYYDSQVKIVSVITTGKMVHKNKILSYAVQVRDMIFQKGISCTADVVEGDNIPKMIIDYALKKEADLIMIMTQQEKSLKEFFIGSAAEQIIKTSDIPVLSIRPVKQNVKYTSFN
jgi:nucleotide-binding universal stress UspA family protein